MPIVLDPIRVGVEPADDAFRLVALRAGSVVTAVEVPIVEGEVPRVEAARRAFAAAERQGVSGVTACVAVAPSHAVTTAILELPPRASGAPIEALAAAEMMRGADGGGIEVALFPIREREGGPVEYFAAGAWREQTAVLMDELAQIGIEITAVDAPVCALGRACGEENCLAVALSAGGMDLHVIQQHQPVLSRLMQLPRGGATPDAIIAEIDRCAAYLSTYRHDSAIDTVVLAGRAAAVAGLSTAIEREFEVRVRAWGSEAVDTMGSGVGSQFAAAFGAATWHDARRAAA